MSDLVGVGGVAAAAGHVTKKQRCYHIKRLDEGDLVNQTNGNDLTVPAATCKS